MRTTKSHLRYFDYCGNVLDAWGKAAGQQGDPLEMIVFCLSVNHLWGRTLTKHHQTPWHTPTMATSRQSCPSP
jgi:hypothetical protein